MSTLAFAPSVRHTTLFCLFTSFTTLYAGVSTPILINSRLDRYWLLSATFTSAAPKPAACWSLTRAEPQRHLEPAILGTKLPDHQSGNSY